MFHFGLLHSSKAVHLLETREKPKAKPKWYHFHHTVSYIHSSSQYIYIWIEHTYDEKKRVLHGLHIYLDSEAMVKKWIWFDTAGWWIYFIFLLLSFFFFMYVGCASVNVFCVDFLINQCQRYCIWIFAFDGIKYRISWSDKIYS